MGEGSSPYFPPVPAACVKRALPFGGSWLLVGVLRHAARWERALPGTVPCHCLPLVRVLCPHGGLMAFPTDLGLCGVWIARRLRWYQ